MVASSGSGVAGEYRNRQDGGGNPPTLRRRQQDIRLAGDLDKEDVVLITRPRLSAPLQVCASLCDEGKYCSRQVDGLAHFARKLRWPDIESYASRISESMKLVTQGTPLTTPLASPSPTPRTESRRSSYFGGGSKDTASVKHTISRRQNLSAALRPSGWLSKSYVSGLVLPGEGLHHFLMSTLLENDQEAMRKLGSMANLCGGFVYYGKSFWSTACIVGRVLAAGKGSAECMGWISSDITPQGLGNGWVNVEVVETLGMYMVDAKKTPFLATPSLTSPQRIPSRSTRRLASGANMLLSGNRTFLAMPTRRVSCRPISLSSFENSYGEQPPAPIKIELTTLSLWAEAGSVHTTPGVEEISETLSSDVTEAVEIPNYTATIRFTVTKLDTDEQREHSYSLSNDIYFVTAHPCVPSRHVKILKSPSSPTIQQVDISGSSSAGKTASVVGKRSSSLPRSILPGTA